MAEVVSLRDGVEIASPGRPVEDLVSCLRTALEMAEAGELAGAVVLCSYADSSASYTLAGFIRGYTAIGALEDAKRHLLENV